MNEQEARQRLRGYLQFLQGDIGYQLPSSWLSDNPEFNQLPNGDWLVRHPEEPHKGILLKSDGKAFPFFGALGSSFQGRYQTYDKGLAIWEAFKDGEDIGYPVARWEHIDKRTKSCLALIAFFDLRGFTKWSHSQAPKRIQDVIEGVEQSFQDAFSRRWCTQLFAKSTGDGFMVISEAGQYNIGEHGTDSSFQVGHVKAFCRACAETVRNAAAQLPDELAIGCGVTVGRITQLYLLGRFDYIGPSVNEASKIQTVAYNELCISTEVVEGLRKGGVEIKGKLLPVRGMRVCAESLITEEGLKPEPVTSS
jgi:class 3 adenylate cyclase